MPHERVWFASRLVANEWWPLSDPPANSPDKHCCTQKYRYGHGTWGPRRHIGTDIKGRRVGPYRVRIQALALNSCSAPIPTA